MNTVLLLICLTMAELSGFNRDSSWRRLQINSINFILQLSTIDLNLTLPLVKEISICSVFLLHKNNNRQRKFASYGSVYGGELPWSCFFFFFLYNLPPSTHEQSFPGLLGIKALAQPRHVFQNLRKKKIEGGASELARSSPVSTNRWGKVSAENDI